MVVSVPPELVPCFSVLPGACVSPWPFTTGGAPGLTLQEPGRNSWGWVGRGLLKAQAASSCPGERFMVGGRVLGMECDAESAEGQPHAGQLAGARGSRL